MRTQTILLRCLQVFAIAASLSATSALACDSETRGVCPGVWVYVEGHSDPYIVGGVREDGVARVRHDGGFNYIQVPISDLGVMEGCTEDKKFCFRDRVLAPDENGSFFVNAIYPGNRVGICNYSDRRLGCNIVLPTNLLFAMAGQ